ncbi:MAG: hypothetical protein KJZ90_00880 [Rhodocyclaceae bacterium]|nr:hypothetical protein [Rhodocyclaceae bacterium]
MFQTKEIELVFIRQEKLSVTVITLLTVITSRLTTRTKVLECLKEATAAWYKAETENSRSCCAAAGDDVNIIDLKMHGAFNDAAFRDVLVSHHIQVKSLQIIHCGDTIPLDTVLFQSEAREEEGPACVQCTPS